MTDLTTSLPEDLEPINHQHSVARTDIRIGNRLISLTHGADKLIGAPVRVEILFGAQTRMLALRPVTEGGWAVTRANAIYAGNADLIAALGLPPISKGHSHRFPARLVEGALLIGPLPKGEA